MDDLLQSLGTPGQGPSRARAAPSAAAHDGAAFGAVLDDVTQRGAGSVPNVLPDLQSEAPMSSDINFQEFDVRDIDPSKPLILPLSDTDTPSVMPWRTVASAGPTPFPNPDAPHDLSRSEPMGPQVLPSPLSTGAPSTHPLRATPQHDGSGPLILPQSAQTQASSVDTRLATHLVGQHDPQVLPAAVAKPDTPNVPHTPNSPTNGGAFAAEATRHVPSASLVSPSSTRASGPASVRPPDSVVPDDKASIRPVAAAKADPRAAPVAPLTTALPYGSSPDGTTRLPRVDSAKLPVQSQQPPPPLVFPPTNAPTSLPVTETSRVHGEKSALSSNVLISKGGQTPTLPLSAAPSTASSAHAPFHPNPRSIHPDSSVQTPELKVRVGSGTIVSPLARPSIWTSPHADPTSAAASPAVTFAAQALPASGIDASAQTLDGIEFGLQSNALISTTLAATSAPQMPHAPAANAQAMAQQIASAMAEPGREPGGLIELALDPPELGRLRMQMTEIAGVMTLTIHAERPETAELMRRHLDLLAQEFAEAGLDAPSVEINNGGADGHGSQAREDQPDGRSHQTLSDDRAHTPPPVHRADQGALDLRL